jgi:DNA recombination protein RmuC
VKTEFGKFGGMLDKARSQTETVLKTLTDADVRTRAMGRVLKQVEALPEEKVTKFIPLNRDEGEDG